MGSGNKIKFPYDYKCIPLGGGAHATITGEPTPELIAALNNMVKIAKKNLKRKSNDSNRNMGSNGKGV
jgi:hypothetical protein